MLFESPLLKKKVVVANGSSELLELWALAERAPVCEGANGEAEEVGRLF